MKKLFLIIILTAVLSDQISKLYINSLIDEEEFIEICGFIKLVEVWNSGVSFGLFNTLPYRHLVFSILAIFIIVALLCSLYKTNDRLVCLGFSLMIGGAIGNVIDRISWKAVYDFIYFHIGDWYWPAFNLADSYIVCGMLILSCKHAYDVYIFKRNSE